MHDSLHVSQVQARLQTTWLGRSYRYFEATDSTNLQMKAALPDLPSGALFLADYQAAGRGRLQRQWEAPPGSSLLLSMLLRPNWPAAQAAWLTMITSLAAAAAIEAATPFTVGVKWPNDLMVQQENGWRKVGGILLDGDLDENGRLRSVIVGMGLNVNVPPDALPQSATPATSLLAAARRPFSRLDLLVDFLERMEAGYETAVAGESPQPAWDRRLILRNQPVIVTQMAAGVTLSGIALGTDAWGQLRIRDDDGVEHTIAAGDVTLRTP